MELFKKNTYKSLTLAEIQAQDYQPVGNTISQPSIVGGTLYGTSFKSVSNSATLDILPSFDSTIGIRILSSNQTNVLLATIDGTDTGDITIGNYAGGQGLKYDFSADTFSLTGAFSAGSISIGTSPNWFRCDTSGNIWSGADTLATAKTTKFAVENTGALYATGATISGTLTATAGTIGGFTLSSTALYAGTGATRIQLDTTSGIHLGATAFADAPFRVTLAGALTAINATITGSITATTGAIGGWTISSTAIYLDGATDALSSGMASADYPFYAGKKYADRATAPFRVTPAGALYASSATVSGAITAGAGSSLPTTYLSGIVGLSNTNISAQGWTNTCVFSATDYNTIAWALGTFTTAGGTAYSITAGNTGNMAATTYIYLDIAVSTTVLQTTTTAATAIGSGKVLIAVASVNSDTTSKATVQVFGGTGGQIMLVDNIAANSASTNEFVSNTAQIANLVVTDAKIASLVANKITAGTGIIANLDVLSTLTMGSAATNGTIQSYGWNGTANGFQILGGATPSITLIGGTITGGTIQTATGTGRRVIMDSSGIYAYDANNNLNIRINILPVGAEANIYSLISSGDSAVAGGWFISNTLADCLYLEPKATGSAIWIKRTGAAGTDIHSDNWSISSVGAGSFNSLSFAANSTLGSVNGVVSIESINGSGLFVGGLSVGNNGGTIGDVPGVITLYQGTVAAGSETITYAKWNSLNDINGIVKCNGSGGFSTASAGTDYYAPSGTDIAVADGGTGKSSWTQYLIPYADTTTSFSQIPIGTDGQVLTSGGAGVAPSFETISMDIPYAADAGGSDSYAITLSPAWTSYTVGKTCLFKANTANTDSATLNVNSLGAITIKKKSATNLATNDILANQIVHVAYNELAGQLIDSETTNNDEFEISGGGSFSGYGNTVTNVEANTTLTSVVLSLKKEGSPTGTCVCKVYTRGASDYPASPYAGNILATSSTLDVSTLTTSFVSKTFTFTGAEQILMAAATSYFLTIEYTGGDSSNSVHMELDTNGSGGGYYQNSTSTWYQDSNTKALIFSLYGTQKRFEMLSQIAN